MLNWRFILSSLALMVASFILAISLTQAVPQAFGNFDSSKRQLYFHDDILPDHVAYPALMAIDRARLESASEIEKVYLELEYGNRRFEYAAGLLKKDNHGLALTTLTKGYKYFIKAAQEALDQDMPDSVKQQVLTTLKYQSKQLKNLRGEFVDNQASVIDQLLEEGRVLSLNLESSL